jgi:alkylation response protein AidB-like acyl-CoA dehydrogenase
MANESPRFALSPAEQGLLEAASAIAAPYATRPVAPLALPELQQLFRQLEPTGYLGSVLPVEAGGKGLSPLAFAALVEGLAPNLTLLGNHSVQRYLNDFATPAQRRRFLPGLLSGDEIGAIAITETQAGSDLARLQTVARRKGAGWVLDGNKTWVTHGMFATTFVVLARSGEAANAFTRFIVPAGTPGLERHALASVGLAHLSFAELELKGCELPDELRLGGEGEGARGTKSAFPLARALAALQALRIAGAALAIASDYARERLVADRPLAEQSLVQRGHAELWGRIEAARLLSYRVAADPGSADAVALASAAKALAGELALDASRWALDTLGSSSLVADHALVRLHDDARMMAVVDGTSVLNHLVVARRGIARRWGRDSGGGAKA